jgi:hypothetical protein
VSQVEKIAGSPSAIYTLMMNFHIPEKPSNPPKRNSSITVPFSIVNSAFPADLAFKQAMTVSLIPYLLQE